MDSEEFKLACSTGSAKAIAADFINYDSEWIFKNQSERESFYGRLEDGLKMGRENMSIVGSAKYGWSMDPSKFGIPFNSNSDIDVIIINPVLFDRLWLLSSEWCYPTKTTPIEALEKAKKKTMKDIFYGAINPKYFIYEVIKSPEHADLRQERDKWHRAFHSMSRDYNSKYSEHKVKGRLYRSMDHAVLYHASGISSLINEWRKNEIS